MRYAANLKRQLARIPMAPEFRRFAGISTRARGLRTTPTAIAIPNILTWADFLGGAGAR